MMEPKNLRIGWPYLTTPTSRYTEEMLEEDVPGNEWKDDKPVSQWVDHPPHYTSHPSGIECIEVTEHMGFNLGNAIKYIWRADEKDNALEDLRKAAWYIAREITKRTSNGNKA